MIVLLTVVLAEAELEMMPKAIVSHPAVVASARKRGKKPEHMLLDSNYHHATMNSLPGGKRRGRPDIVHICLLNALESILNKKGELRLIIHTRNDEEIIVDPKTRIMRNYERFTGLMEQLLQQRYVPSKEKPLLRRKEGQSLQDIIDEEDADTTLVFHKSGKKKDLERYFKGLQQQEQQDVLCIIGGFPKDEFRSPIGEMADDVLSLCDEELVAWTVINKAIVCFENTLFA